MVATKYCKKKEIVKLIRILKYIQANVKDKTCSVLFEQSFYIDLCCSWLLWSTEYGINLKTQSMRRYTMVFHYDGFSIFT